MRDAAYYREKAARFRELAKDSDPQSAKLLVTLAEDYEAEAERLDPSAKPPNPAAE